MAAGLNVFLVSRNSVKLKAAASEIETTHGVQCKYYAIDLVEAAGSGVDEAIWKLLAQELSLLDVGILVNNAGACYAYPELFSHIDPDTVHDLPAINMASLVKMTYIVLPGMMQRRRGAIINISSIAASRIAEGLPLISLYAATKAFVENFSGGLAEECKHAGIHVQVC